LALCLFCVGGAAPAALAAAIDQTWVSGFGNDSNPCTRTAPCATLAGAYALTLPGGEIDALDPGDFGSLTIAQALTINLGSVGRIGNGTTDGIIVDAGPTDDVLLRGISVNGDGSGACPRGGLSGIVVRNARTVRIERVAINNQRVAGISVAPTSSDPTVVINHGVLRNGCGAGLAVDPSAGHTASVMVRDLTISGTAVGIHAGASADIVLSATAVTGNALGVELAGDGRISAFVNTQVYANTVNGTLSRFVGWAVRGPDGANGANGITPTAAAPLAPLARAAMHVQPQDGALKVPVTCRSTLPIPLSACSVTISTTLSPPTQTKRASPAAPRRFVIGSATTTSAGGRTLVATVRLNAIGRAALRQVASLPITVTRTATTTGGGESTATTRTTLVPLASAVVPSDGSFDTGSWTLTRSGIAFIAATTKQLASSKLAHLTCTGYTDNTGLEQDNLWLSKRRAEAACAALQSYGVHATSTMIVGKGAGDPRATNATAAGRALNRRIELIVTYEPATQHGGATRAGPQARSTSSAT